MQMHTHKNIPAYANGIHIWHTYMQMNMCDICTSPCRRILNCISIFVDWQNVGTGQPRAATCENEMTSGFGFFFVQRVEILQWVASMHSTMHWIDSMQMWTYSAYAKAQLQIQMQLNMQMCTMPFRHYLQLAKWIGNVPFAFTKCEEQHLLNVRNKFFSILTICEFLQHLAASTVTWKDFLLQIWKHFCSYLVDYFCSHLSSTLTLNIFLFNFGNISVHI